LKILIEEAGGKLTHERPSCKWDNIKIDLKEIGHEGVDLIGLRMRSRIF
jgi:hypothetical protein